MSKGTLWHATVVDAVEGKLDAPAAPDIDRISHAMFAAEDAVKEKVDELIRAIRNDVLPGATAEKIRGIRLAAAALGIEPAEGVYAFADGVPITRGGFTEHSVTVPANPGETDEVCTVTARLVACPETFEVYYDEILDYPDCVSTLDSGFVAADEAAEHVRNILFHGMDVLYENAADQNVAVTESVDHENREQALKAEADVRLMVASMRHLASQR